MGDVGVVPCDSARYPWSMSCSSSGLAPVHVQHAAHAEVQVVSTVPLEPADELLSWHVQASSATPAGAAHYAAAYWSCAVAGLPSPFTGPTLLLFTSVQPFGGDGSSGQQHSPPLR